MQPLPSLLSPSTHSPCLTVRPRRPRRGARRGPPGARSWCPRCGLGRPWRGRGPAPTQPRRGFLRGVRPVCPRPRRGRPWYDAAPAQPLAWRGLALDARWPAIARPAPSWLACPRHGLGTHAACLPAARSGHGAQGARGQLDPRPMPSLANSTREGRSPLFLLLLLSTLFYFCLANRTLMDHVNGLVLYIYIYSNNTICMLTTLT
jgi:hypothetical protein